ncbi:hypothetical protein RF11_06386 [Thelohanellus kitauei]|uniref:Uncharacterized protein n=1 Tax=Thelohanellus kitauei TaxID=669202 RepID=A0A0C2ME63_THEKT|nr:hypothetical protein RF11_06386 [Thelohanellus kitauei]
MPERCSSSSAWEAKTWTKRNKDINKVTKTTVDDEIEIGDHVECERYAVIVKKYGKLVKYQHYTYVPRDHLASPTDLAFDSEAHILSWTAASPSCFAPTFYVKRF